MHDHHDHDHDEHEEEVALRDFDEFSPNADEWDASDGVGRRTFLKTMGAALAMAGLTGCSSRPRDEKLVPHVVPPPGVIPGRPLSYATAVTLAGYAHGILAISREGRPIKVEGNPDHPASTGSSNAQIQATILDLYDPTRIQSPMRAGNNIDWPTFYNVAQNRLDDLARRGGAGLRFVSGAITSPTLIAQIGQLQQKFPKMRWHIHEPLARTSVTEATQQAFGRPLNPIYDFSKAKLIVSLDSDFLFDEPGSLQYARHFSAGHRVRKDKLDMSRLYVIESSLTLTGSVADHRVAVRPGEVGKIAAQLNGGEAASGNRVIDALIDDLKNAAPGTSLVIAGPNQPAAVHALAYAINAAKGNIGQTIKFTEPVEFGAGDATRSLKALVDDINAGGVEALFVLCDNPVMTSPADVAFARALESLTKAKNPDGSFKNLTVHLGQYANETSFLCQYVLPESHYLEAWGDARAFDGTASIVQPLILPLYNSKSCVELLARMLGDLQPNGYEILRKQYARPNLDAWWSETLQRGTIAGTAAPVITGLTPKPTASPSVAAGGAASGIDVIIKPCYSILDGRFARNPWLQEVPRPFSKIVWDNAALISPSTAKDMGLKADEVIRISTAGHSVELPINMIPGLPDNTITVHLGYGAGKRPPKMEHELDPVGANVYAIRTTANPQIIAGATIEKTGKTHKLVSTRSRQAMADMQYPNETPHGKLANGAVVTPQTDPLEVNVNSRRLVRIFSIGEFKANPKITTDLGGEKEHKPLLTMYDRWDYSKGWQWAMSIDTSACIGCNACLVACQAENNIPVVGKEQVEKQRDMHWIRIDSYFSGDNIEADPTITHQPVPCQHCEDAPCEYVCPVGATGHSTEGLNMMTYNRCVGTRYCSNNCPYKVRRFNFLDYNAWRRTKTREMQSNPEVTVRVRGVMEKCTFCVQRIEQTRVTVEGKLLKWQEQLEKYPERKDDILKESRNYEFNALEQLQTACQQSCPTQAIVFGSQTTVDADQQPTAVKKLKNEPLDYVLLRELGTRPRTSYMARVRNPHPSLAPAASQVAAAPKHEGAH